MKAAYINGKFVPLDKARVSVLDRGFQYGEGVFETMRAYRGFVFLPGRHLARLKKSLKALGIRKKIPEKKLRKIIPALLKRNNRKDAYVKIIATKKTLLIYSLPYKSLPETEYARGYGVRVSRSAINGRNSISGKKTLNYLENVTARARAGEKGFDEAVLTDAEGNVAEATGANIFIFKNGKLVTPRLESGILPGITRGEVLRLAKKILKNRVVEKAVRKSDLYSAEEVFITNSLIEIMPVVRVDRKKIGSGKPGPLTGRLRGLLKESISKNCRNR